MFKNLTINLTGPICGCTVDEGDNAPLSWGLSLTDEGMTLIMKCKKCKTKVYVPTSTIGAHFNLDEGYPKEEAPEPGDNVKKLKIVKEEGDEHDE